MGVGIYRMPTYDSNISRVPGKPGVMVHTFKSSTEGAEADGFCEFLKLGLRKAKATSLRKSVSKTNKREMKFGLNGWLSN